MNNILIVDDAKIDRQIISNLLKKSLNNLNIYELDNGYDVVDYIIDNNIIACILDIMMPGKSGLDVLKELKENSKTRNIPVIIYTSVDEIESIKKALEFGASDYFTKPLSEEVMKISLPLKVKNAMELFSRNQEIFSLSYYDKLTGLYNRRFFEEELFRLDTPRSYPLSIIVTDINGLKIKNDIFGHLAGDKLISDIGNVIKNSCRQVDVVCRWGGDEFFVLLPNTSSETVEAVCNRIINNCNLQKEEIVNLSVAIGHATKESKEDDINDIIKCAELKMYKDKIRNGRFFYGQVIDKITSRLISEKIESSEHFSVLSELSYHIGGQLNLNNEEMESLQLLSRYHDIGKIMIDSKLLKKKEPLSENDFEEIKSHSEIGYKMIKSFPDLLHIADYVLYNHERWDGSGYPIGLTGDKIPKIVRLFSIIEAYTVMTQENTYKCAITKNEAIREIKLCSGNQFDPYLVEHFCRTIEILDI